MNNGMTKGTVNPYNSLNDESNNVSHLILPKLNVVTLMLQVPTEVVNHVQSLAELSHCFTP